MTSDPQMVKRVARAMEARQNRARDGFLRFPRLAETALEASHHAELVGFTHDVRELLVILARYGEDSVWRAAQRRLVALDAVLAKIGGGQ